MQFTPYLNFDGNCREAFAFYKDLFKGTVVHQSTFGEIPPDPQNPPIPPEAKDRLMHVHLQVGAQALMGSDTLPGASDVCAGGYAKPQGLWVSIQADDVAEGRRVFDALAQGGQGAQAGVDHQQRAFAGRERATHLVEIGRAHV